MILWKQLKHSKGDHGGDSINTTCAVVRDVTAYIAVVRVFRFSSEYYGCRYHRCPYFSAHRANRSSLISAFITENCQEGIYHYYKRLSSFLNIKTITRIYFEYKTSFSRVFFLLSTYATIPCKRKYQGYYAFHLAFESCNHLPNSLRPSNFISRF